MKNDPAFPQPLDTDDVFPRGEGLTKREYFAAMAMQGILANPDKSCVELNNRVLVESSTFIAESLINYLEKENG